jgi:hypothetical protein
MDDPDENEDVRLVERWEQVVRLDVGQVTTWLEDQVAARLGHRMHISVRAACNAFKTPVQRIAVDGRRGADTLTTARRAFAGLLKGLDTPFAGELQVAVQYVGEPPGPAAAIAVPVLVGQQDRLRKGPTVRELQRRLAWTKRRSRETERALTLFYTSAPTLLEGAAAVIEATRGVNLAPPSAPSQPNPAVQAAIDALKAVFSKAPPPAGAPNPADLFGDDGSPPAASPSEDPPVSLDAEDAVDPSLPAFDLWDED